MQLIYPRLLSAAAAELEENTALCFAPYLQTVLVLDFLYTKPGYSLCLLRCRTALRSNAYPPGLSASKERSSQSRDVKGTASQLAGDPEGTGAL